VPRWNPCFFAARAPLGHMHGDGAPHRRWRLIAEGASGMTLSGNGSANPRRPEFPDDLASLAEQAGRQHLGDWRVKDLRERKPVGNPHRPAAVDNAMIQHDADGASGGLEPTRIYSTLIRDPRARPAVRSLADAPLQSGNEFRGTSRSNFLDH